MLDNLRDMVNRAGTTDGDSPSLTALDSLLQDRETIQYVSRSSKGIEQTTDGETRSIQPDDDHDAYAVVTDFRVFFLVESDDEDPAIDVEFDLASITRANVRDGLLHSSLVIGSQRTTVKFTPSDGPDLAEVTDYVDRISDSWVDLEHAIEAAREAIESFEARLEAGEDAHEALTTARSRLSNARHHATHNDDGPVEAMVAMVEPVEARLVRIQVQGRLDRVEDLLAEAESRDAFDDTVALLVEARDRLDEARDAFDEAAFDDADLAETIEERATAIDDLAGQLLADAEAICHRALDAKDATGAAEIWETARKRYRTLLTTDWKGLGDVDADAIDFQLAWVLGNRVDALCAIAADLAASVDDDSEGATEQYERAKIYVESAHTLAEDHSALDAARFADRLDELDEKIEMSEWQWGDA